MHAYAWHARSAIRPVAERLLSVEKYEVFEMQNAETNISAEGMARPFARIVASEFTKEAVQSTLASGCYLSSGTDPCCWRDAGDDGT